MERLPGDAVGVVAEYLGAGDLAVWGMRVCRSWRDAVCAEPSYWDALRRRRFDDLEVSSCARAEAPAAPPASEDAAGARARYEQRCAEEREVERWLAALSFGDASEVSEAEDALRPLAARALPAAMREAAKRPEAARWGHLLAVLVVPVIASEWARVRELAGAGAEAEAEAEAEALLVGAVAYSRLVVPSVSHAKTAAWVDDIAAGFRNGAPAGLKPRDRAVAFARYMRFARHDERARERSGVSEAARHCPLWCAAYEKESSARERALLYMLVGARAGLRMEAVDAPPTFMLRCCGVVIDPATDEAPSELPASPPAPPARACGVKELFISLHRALFDSHNRRHRTLHAALTVVSLLDLGAPAEAYASPLPADAPLLERKRREAMQCLRAARDEAVARRFDGDGREGLLQRYVMLDHNLHLFHGGRRAP